MPRPIQATIHTHNMSHNLEQIRNRLVAVADPVRAANIQIYAVVKANAYGHGLDNAIKGFSRAQGLAIIEIEQIIKARELGWQKGLLLLEGFFDKSDIAILQKYRVNTAIHNFAQIDLLNELPSGAQVSVLLKINTGMNRLGFKPAQVALAHAQLFELQQQGKIQCIGFMCHFANADAPNKHLVDEPWHIMRDAIAPFMVKLALDETGSTSGTHLSTSTYQEIEAVQVMGLLSVCNSAACLRFPEFALSNCLNIVRPGICLYGSSPMAMLAGETAADYDLKPTMSLKAQLIAVQDLQIGDEVGYGGLFKAEGAMRMGVVACGYADGYPRSATHNTPVIIRGVRSHIIGRVSMDMLAIDLTHVPHAGVGDWVNLWGEGGPTIDEVADSSGRISYEIMCGLTKRVPLIVD